MPIKYTSNALCDDMFELKPVAVESNPNFERSICDGAPKKVAQRCNTKRLNRHHPRKLIFSEQHGEEEETISPSSQSKQPKAVPADAKECPAAPKKKVVRLCNPDRLNKQKRRRVNGFEERDVATTDMEVEETVPSTEFMVPNEIPISTAEKECPEAPKKVVRRCHPDRANKQKRQKVNGFEESDVETTDTEVVETVPSTEFMVPNEIPISTAEKECPEAPKKVVRRCHLDRANKQKRRKVSDLEESSVETTDMEVEETVRSTESMVPNEVPISTAEKQCPGAPIKLARLSKSDRLKRYKPRKLDVFQERSVEEAIHPSTPSKEPKPVPTVPKECSGELTKAVQFNHDQRYCLDGQHFCKPISSEGRNMEVEDFSPSANFKDAKPIQVPSFTNACPRTPIKSSRCDLERRRDMNSRTVRKLNVSEESSVEINDMEVKETFPSTEYIVANTITISTAAKECPGAPKKVARCIHGESGHDLNMERAHKLNFPDENKMESEAVTPTTYFLLRVFMSFALNWTRENNQDIYVKLQRSSQDVLSASNSRPPASSDWGRRIQDRQTGNARIKLTYNVASKTRKAMRNVPTNQAVGNRVSGMSKCSGNAPDFARIPPSLSDQASAQVGLKKQIITQPLHKIPQSGRLNTTKACAEVVNPSSSVLGGTNNHREQTAAAPAPSNDLTSLQTKRKLVQLLTNEDSESPLSKKCRRVGSIPVQTSKPAISIKDRHAKKPRKLNFLDEDDMKAVQVSDTKEGLERAAAFALLDLEATASQQRISLIDDISTLSSISNHNRTMQKQKPDDATASIHCRSYKETKAFCMETEVEEASCTRCRAD